MTRTAVNVFGDSCAAVVIAKSEGEAVLQGTVNPLDPPGGFDVAAETGLARGTA